MSAELLDSIIASSGPARIVSEQARRQAGESDAAYAKRIYQIIMELSTKNKELADKLATWTGTAPPTESAQN